MPTNFRMCIEFVRAEGVQHIWYQHIFWTLEVGKGMAWARAGDVVASYVVWTWAGMGMGMGVGCHELGLQACTLPYIALVDIATTPL